MCMCLCCLGSLYCCCVFAFLGHCLQYSPCLPGFLGWCVTLPTNLTPPHNLQLPCSPPHITYHYTFITPTHHHGLCGWDLDCHASYSPIPPTSHTHTTLPPLPIAFLHTPPALYTYPHHHTFPTFVHSPSSAHSPILLAAFFFPTPFIWFWLISS